MKLLLLGMASFFAAWAGMATLCFGSPTQRHRLGLPVLHDRQRLYRMAGGILLLSLSLLAAIRANGMPFGTVLWLCQSGMAGLALVCVLPYFRAWANHTARAAALLAPALAAIAYRI